MLSKVRASCRALVERASHARIDPQRVAAFSAEIRDAESALGRILFRAQSSPAAHMCEPVVFGGGSDPVPVPVAFADDAAEVDFCCVLALSQLGSGFRVPLHLRGGQRGRGASDTMTLAIVSLHTSTGGLSARTLAGLSRSDVARALDCCCCCCAEDPPELCKLVDIAHDVLRGAGEALLSAGVCGFSELVAPFARPGASVSELVSLLVETVPGFKDAAVHSGEPVLLCKKAQLCASDLHARFADRGRFVFSPEGLAELTAFVDNVIPAVLRSRGVITLSEALEASISSGKPLLSGSAEEVELRAAALVACEDIVESANKQPGSPITARDLDWMLWVAGKLPELRKTKRHVCQDTPYY